MLTPPLLTKIKEKNIPDQFGVLTPVCETLLYGDRCITLQFPLPFLVSQVLSKARSHFSGPGGVNKAFAPTHTTQRTTEEHQSVQHLWQMDSPQMEMTTVKCAGRHCRALRLLVLLDLPRCVQCCKHI